jgi:hypothetical protein
MSIFIDKKFEQLDWISKAVEPMESNLNEVLSYLPEEIEVTKQDIVDHIVRSQDEMKYFWLIRPHIQPNHLSLINDESLITRAYKLQCRNLDGSSLDDEDSDNYLGDGPLKVRFDSSTDEISAKLFLVKVKAALSEEEMSMIFGRKGINAIANLAYNIYPSDEYNARKRMLELIDLLGPVPDFKIEKTTSTRKTVKFLRNFYSRLCAKNTMNIKSVELIDKLAEWMVDYVLSADAIAIANIGKLKVMTSFGQPVYSMEYEVGNDSK